MGTRQKKPVTFICEYCSQEVTELHGPGQLPHYCAACYAEAQRHLNKLRVRAYREKHAPDPLAPRRSRPGSWRLRGVRLTGVSCPYYVKLAASASGRYARC